MQHQTAPHMRAAVSADARSHPLLADVTRGAFCSFGRFDQSLSADASHFSGRDLAGPASTPSPLDRAPLQESAVPRPVIGPSHVLEQSMSSSRHNHGQPRVQAGCPPAPSVASRPTARPPQISRGAMLPPQSPSGKNSLFLAQRSPRTDQQRQSAEFRLPNLRQQVSGKQPSAAVPSIADWSFSGHRITPPPKYASLEQHIPVRGVSLMPDQQAISSKKARC